MVFESQTKLISLIPQGQRGTSIFLTLNPGVENRSFAFEGFDMMLAGSESAARADPGHLVDLIEVDENTGLRAWILPVEPAVRSDLAALMRYRLSRAIRGGRWSQSEGHFGAIAGKTIA
jgi:hypothetical protein